MENNVNDKPGSPSAEPEKTALEKAFREGEMDNTVRLENDKKNQETEMPGALPGTNKSGQE
jgi:hypothetical protein